MGFFSAFLFVFIWWWEGFSSSWFKMSVSWSSQSQSQLYPFGPLCYMPVFWNFTLEPFQGGSVSNTRFWANSTIAWKICCRLSSYVRDGGWSGGRVMWKCRVNVQCRGVLLIWIMVGQGPVALAVGAGGGCLGIFLSSIISLLSPPLWETARYRLKYCLKGLLNPKQPTNQILRWEGLSLSWIRVSVSWSARFLVFLFPSNDGKVFLHFDLRSLFLVITSSVCLSVFFLRWKGLSSVSSSVTLSWYPRALASLSLCLFLESGSSSLL